MVDADVRLEPVLRRRYLAVVVGNHDASVTDLGAGFEKLLEKYLQDFFTQRLKISTIKALYKVFE